MRGGSCSATACRTPVAQPSSGSYPICHGGRCPLSCISLSLSQESPCRPLPQCAALYCIIPVYAQSTSPPPPRRTSCPQTAKEEARKKVAGLSGGLPQQRKGHTEKDRKRMRKVLEKVGG